MPEKNELPLRCANPRSRCRLWNQSVDDPEAFVLGHPEIKVAISGSESSMKIARETTYERDDYSQA